MKAQLRPRVARVFAAMSGFLPQVLCLACQPGQTLVIWRRLPSTFTRRAGREASRAAAAVKRRAPLGTMELPRA
jgi:hypothetical protein